MSETKKDFWEQYSKYCLQNKLYPSPTIKRYLKGSELCLPVEAVRPEHWHYLLSSLCFDNNLTKVHFGSCVVPFEEDIESKQKKNKRDKGIPAQYGRSPENVRNICMCLAGMLRSSQALIILKLERLSITCFDAKQLSVGLSESRYLKLLSFSGCYLEPGALKIICDGLSRSYVTWLDLTAVPFEPEDIVYICNVIKAHGIRRANEMYPQTLRYNLPNLDELHGINRISFNSKYMDYEVLNFLVHRLRDDLWIKALDLQMCGINNSGANLLLYLATTNNSIEIIDLRKNEAIEESVLQRIEQQLALNRAGKTQTCTYAPLFEPSEMLTKFNAIGKGKLKKTPVYKCKIKKKVYKSNHHSVKSPFIIRVKVQDASVQTPLELYKEIPEKVQDLVNSLRGRLYNEKKIRHYYEIRCKRFERENAFLREYLQNQSDDIYIDQETYFDIKHTFEKLKIFFDVMKKYGLWEYISMLGFDESTDVVIKEDESLKCVKVLKKETPMGIADAQESKIVVEPCCNCRKTDPKHSHTETADALPEDGQNCVSNPSTKKPHNKSKALKTDDPLDERVAYKLLQEVMNDYNNSLLHQVYNMKSKHKKMTNAVNALQDSAKASCSKLSTSASPKAASGAHMLIKKFSYAKIPKQLKELVSPVDFYTIVKKELERCGKEIRKSSSHAESSSQTNSQTPPQTKVSTEKPTTDSTEVNAIHQRKETSKKVPVEVANEDDYENITISELIARERASKQRWIAQKYIPTKKEPAKSSTPTVSTFKINKPGNYSRVKDMKSLSKSEPTLPKSKLKQSSSSQTTSKRVLANASSDEINSSDSVVTASDKLSSSSASSSSSGKSHVKTSSSHNDNQKSYLESVSDASTFKDVESISDIEVVSQGLSQRGGEKEEIGSKNKSLSLAKTTKDVSASSQSSTLKDAVKSKSGKSDEVAKSESSSIRNASNKSDKSAKTNASSQAKTKNADKLISKNRPKSNSSKSSSVPSLSDITTVSSKSLNTDSIMKQITDSEDNSKRGN